MSGAPLDDPPNGGGPGLDSGVLPHLDVPEAGQSRLTTADLEWRELRDALWLANALFPSVTDTPAPRVPAAPPPPPTPSTPPSPAGEEREEPFPQPPPPTETAPASAPEPQDWHVGPPHEVRAAGYDQGVSAAPLVWPSAPALPNSRLIARALRPLGRRTPSRFRVELNEEATAERAAQDRLWLPEFRPESWHEFELVVVVDTAGAAEVWQQLVRELCDLLRRQGAFRNVRVLLVDGTVTSGEDVVLRAEGSEGATSGWRDHVDPTGRTLFLVLTDGIGDGWRSGVVTSVVASWARYSPVALVNLLPQRLWHLSGLTPSRVRLRAARPGSPNGRLQVRTENGLSRNGSVVPIPVLGLEPEWWAAWARLIGVRGSGWVNLTTVFVESDAVDKEAEPEPIPAPEDIPPRERVLRFRTFASVPAFQLAGLLAAVPLSLPTIKLVQRVLLPTADLSAIAEVLLGGLLRRTSLRPDDRDAVGYEFHKGVREELLSTGRRSDTVRVARLIGDHLGPRNPIVRNFREALTDPDNTPEPEPTEETRPYLRVQEAVFRALSGKYGPRAGRLRAKLRRDDQDPLAQDLDHAATLAGQKTVQPREEHVTATESQSLPQPLPVGGEMTAAESSQVEGSGRVIGRQPRIWGAVPLRNPDFVGREELLERLRIRLTEPEVPTAVLPEALHGMGGVGKSQTVVEYIYRHAHEYDVVWWIPSEHATTIRSSFVDLAKRLGSEASTAETAVPAVLEALRSSGQSRRWILVFDNAERPDVLKDFLPTGNGHVVVTSRNAEWGRVARTVEVDLFTREESIELLRRRGGSITDEDADRLAEALGDLPLAVEQAASWRAQTGMPVSEYVDLLEKNSAELLQAGASSEYELPVAAAWNVPLTKLRADGRGALELLQVCAFFSPEPISRSLFTGVRGAPVPDALAEAFGDPIKLNQAIREINRYSLAKIDHSRNTLQLHRLVQAVLRDQLDRAQWENMRHSVHLMLVNGDPGDPDNSANWPVYADLLPHAINSNAVDCDDSWVRTLVTNLVRYLASSGDYRGALSLADSAWEAWQETPGEQHVDTLVMGRYRANALRRVGRTADAREFNSHVYALMRENLGEDHEATIGMAEVHLINPRSEGRLVEERDESERIFGRARRVLGEDDPATLVYANNFANRLRLTGEYFDARDLDQLTLRRRTAVLGGTHVSTLNTRIGLAMDIRECGQYVEACEMQEETSALAAEVLGRDHPLTIGGDRCLAVARRKAGLHDRAMELTEDVYNRYQLRHGEGHIDTVTAMMDMTTELRHAGDLERSLDFGVRSVRDFEHVYYAEHPFAMIAVTNLAVTRRLVGDVDEARKLNERAVAGFLSRLPEDHPYVLVARANLASDLAELGQLEEARQIDEDTVERCTRKLGPEHPTTLAVAHNLSIDLNLLGNTDEAALLHAKTSASFRKVLGDEHPATLAAGQNVRANCDTDTMQL